MPRLDTEQNHWFSTELEPYEPMLRAWLRNRFPCVLSCDDIVQESYLRVLRARKVSVLKAPKAFLFQTALNLALDHLRSHGVSKTTSLSVVQTEEMPDLETAVPELVTRRQELEALRTAIEALPERCRRVVTLVRVYGVPKKEVASRLGISLNTVSNQLAIGLRKCADLMEQYTRERSA